MTIKQAHTDKKKDLSDQIVQTVIVYMVYFKIGIVALYMATGYSPWLLSTHTCNWSVNSVNSNHVISYCMLAMTRSNTLNIAVKH